MSWGPSWRAGLAAALLAVVLAACAEPALPDGDTGEPAPPPPEAEQPDPGRDALRAELAALVSTVEAARDHLAQAMAADDLRAANAAGAQALSLLLVDPAGTPPDAATSPDRVPLFPAESAEREVADVHGSRLVATLTIAREAGEFGRRTADVLGDVAGDLGSWQRDAEGMVEFVNATVQGPADLDELEAAVLELPGDATRALAWSILVADAATTEAAAAYAERGIAHLDLVMAALRTLDEPGTSGDAEGDGA